MAMIVEGFTLFGILQITERGLVQVPDSSRFTAVFLFAGALAFILAFVFSYRMCYSSYSPALHQKRAPTLIGGGYIILGLLVTTIAYVTNSVLLWHISVPNQEETIFGVSIGVVLGFSMLVYFDRFEFKHPEGREKLENLINNLTKEKQRIEDSSNSPVRLTSRYRSLSQSLEEIAGILGESSIADGKYLSAEMEEWVRVFRNKPEVSQAAIVESSRPIDDKELRQLRQQFDSIVERLGRISKNG